MNFRPQRRDPPELNLIPMIDVLIVLLIFLVLTTTFSREAELQVNLPEASGSAPTEDKSIQVTIDAEGHYVIGKHPTVNNQPDTVKKALREIVGENPDPLIVINADRNATHQAVMTVLSVATELGFKHVTFATSESGSDAAPR
jgi:biopolymer transport protein ExbD